MTLAYGVRELKVQGYGTYLSVFCPHPLLCLRKLEARA